MTFDWIDALAYSLLFVFWLAAGAVAAIAYHVAGMWALMTLSAALTFCSMRWWL